VTELQAANGTSYFVDVNGVKLHYLDYGRAEQPALLCVHGGGAHAHWYDYAAPGLRSDYHVRSLDLRGHGDSGWADDPQTYSFPTYAADLNALVEALDLRDFVLVGHSMGGMVSLLYAATYPGRVGRLVIVDSIMLMPLANVARMHDFGARPPRTYASQDELIARYRLEPAGSQLAAPAIVERMARHSGRQDGDGQWRHKADRRTYAHFQQQAGIPLWERIKVPALAIRGERSTRFTPAILDEIRALAPQVQLAEVPASDHHLMLDNPPSFVEVVRQFLSDSR
jgi:pimeloyl-ACP methyl ester carboxylesterase